MEWFYSVSVNSMGVQLQGRFTPDKAAALSKLGFVITKSVNNQDIVLRDFTSEFTSVLITLTSNI
jgi:hypothetical protein